MHLISAIAPRAFAILAVGVVLADFVAPPPNGGGSRAVGVLPFRFGRQLVAMSGFLGHPL